MGVYIITGGSNGIGASAIQYLKDRGHDTVNIDLDGGDVCVDLGTVDGRGAAIEAVKRKYADGIDGLILNAGIAYDDKPSKIVSINYFGVTALADGLYELLRKKKGSCAVTSSSGIAFMKRGKYWVDALLISCSNETRIGHLVDSFPEEGKGLNIYGSTKMALAIWVRRNASFWAADGVNLNAILPGTVDTALLPTEKKQVEEHRISFNGYPMPLVCNEDRMMHASEVGPALAMLTLPETKGMSGTLMYCDGGLSALIHPEKL